MAYNQHSTIVSRSYVDGIRTTADVPTEVHKITMTWVEEAAPATAIGTCVATLKKSSTFWKLEVPAFQITGMSTAGGGGHTVYATFTDTNLLFGASATTWQSLTS
jgi:hypothetical protein